MGEQVIVGAGLAGLVAAVNLRREGHEVLVLEKESRIGGSRLFHPSPEGTPVDLEGLKRYIGIDVGPQSTGSAVQPFEIGRAVVHERMIPINMDAISAFMIERGPRSTSLDSYLFEIASSAGVRFEFNQPVVSSDDMARLPPDTIIATGLNFDGFDAARVPYRTSFHFAARRISKAVNGNHVTVYFDTFTYDYSYTCSTNGITMAHVFGRDPIGKDTLERFQERVFISEGLEFDSWEHFTSPLPVASPGNPRLFSGNKILAGTLAGCMEPYMCFGMLGALVSGKIAAIAVSDRTRALEEFKLATSSFAPTYLLRKAAKFVPRTLEKYVLQVGLGWMPVKPVVAGMAKQAMPGWRNTGG